MSSEETVKTLLPIPSSPVTPGLKRLLFVLFGLFAMLGVGSLYLSGVTLLEWTTNEIFQDHFYQIMFLMHLVLGLIAIIPVLAFGALHGRNAWSRPNRRAVRAGLGLLATAIALLASGVALTRLGFFELKDPRLREGIYWVHVMAPLVAVWLFVLHRLAGAGIRWRIGGGLASGALALFVLAFLFRIPLSPGDPFSASSVSGEDFPPKSLAPSLAKTIDGNRIPADSLMMDEYCKDCHGDVHEAWFHSAHRLSSFNNPAYLFSVRETRAFSRRTTGNDQGARFCAGCHDPVPLFSGAFDDPDFDDVEHPTARAGITCTSCHAIIRIDSPRGNADYTIEAPRHYPFANSRNPFLQWVNHQLIKAKPAFHRITFLKPLHKTPDFCGVCHKVHIPKAVNQYKWLRGQNHYDAYHLSGVSGHGAMSFYYPPKAIHKCAVCHMPSVPSDDFGAAFLDGSSRLQVHDHRFRAANTALPRLLDLPEAVIATHRQFLRGALRVDIFGIKEDGRITGKLTAPLRPEVPALEPGKRYLLEVVIRNLRVGHLFTQGTADSNQVWLDVTAQSGGTIIGRSGAIADAENQSPMGEVDPWSHFVNAYLLDREGNRIDRRNGQDIFTKLYDHQIPPGAADVAHFALDIPNHVRGTVTVRVKLRYRKFDTTYLRHFQGEKFVANNLPITTIAEDQVKFPVRTSSKLVIDGIAAPPPLPGESPQSGMREDNTTTVFIPAWERWNDYGIGLLRKGVKGSSKGELRQAEQAFTRVERLGKADGPLNLARVYWKEGRLADAGAALRRAARFDPPAWPWVIEWFTGLVNKQNGYLDEAIGNFTRILDTDFPEARAREFDFSRDYRVRNELGQTLFERAKRARGPARRGTRESLLRQARDQFLQTLALDPENVAAHYNLALIQAWLGERKLAETHRAAHLKYKPDDNARERVVAIHRRANPAADHAAESIVIYDLQRPGAYGLP
uniref:Cytochrome c554 and c-prime n=1 Tax=Candidatus Kentrum sp. SD TaxID=2126332 RepID=A0A450Y5H1_9GAMM|nr:MAG: Cytochrome c554 and c-prime [Candidatus Kentron sp. SD]VFK40378.1 MAG: Cytochrome c554 and c-prime [Candidatus Kentron sp. SD]VFK78331.1 MAG: Cytochrome c554 and c-prime [Candidatus Kentron sp. SD]